MGLLGEVLEVLLNRFKDRLRMGRPVGSSRVIADPLSLCLQETKRLKEGLGSSQPCLRGDGKKCHKDVGKISRAFCFSVSKPAGVEGPPRRLL